MNVLNPSVSLIAIVTLAGCTGLSVDDSGTLFGTDDTSGSTTSEFCQESLDTSPAPGPECLMGTLSCGDTITGTTEGGSAIWDNDLYTSVFCFVDSSDFDGTERIWAFDQAENTNVTVTLDHCNKAALSVMSWSDTETCPGTGSTINRCEGSNLSGQVDFFTDRDVRWVIGVDTPAGEEGNFTLTVTCS